MKSLMTFALFLAPLTAVADVPGALRPGAAYVMTPAAETGTDRVLLFVPQSDGTVGGPVLSAEGDLLCNAGWSARADSSATGIAFTDIRLSADPCADGLEGVAADLGQVRHEIATGAGISLLDSGGRELFRLTLGG